MDQILASLNLAEFKSLTENAGTTVLDSRPAPEFTQGFIPGSISIGLEGRFGEWAGDLVPFTRADCTYYNSRNGDGNSRSAISCRLHPA